mgnify:FL=1
MLAEYDFVLVLVTINMHEDQTDSTEKAQFSHFMQATKHHSFLIIMDITVCGPYYGKSCIDRTLSYLGVADTMDTPLSSLFNILRVFSGF